MTEMDYLHRTWVEIDVDAILNNLSEIKKISNKKVYAVVKADAYGHGAVAISRVLEKNGADGFAVSNLLEAEELRQAGVKAPILILGYTPVELAYRLAKSNISQCVFSKEYAMSLDKQAKVSGVKIDVHLKLDTGMGRIGFDCRTDELLGICDAKEVLSLSNLNAEGVFTHFAVADGVSDEDKDFTNEQYSRFKKAVSVLEETGHKFKVCHCGNSAATLTLKMDNMDAVRAGIILYGLTPDTSFPLPKDFKPAMSMYSVVSGVKTVDSGQTIGYGRTYKTEEKRKIATVTAGYADGVPRLLSNNGFVIIHGKRAAIVGKVCMDQFCVDVTDIENVAAGDTVTIFGEGLPVEEVAKEAGTINYEIVCGITKRVPRILI